MRGTRNCQGKNAYLRDFVRRVEKYYKEKEGLVYIEQAGVRLADPFAGCRNANAMRPAFAGGSKKEPATKLDACCDWLAYRPRRGFSRSSSWSSMWTYSSRCCCRHR